MSILDSLSTCFWFTPDNKRNSFASILAGVLVNIIEYYEYYEFAVVRDNSDKIEDMIHSKVLLLLLCVCVSVRQANIRHEQ